MRAVLQTLREGSSPGVRGFPISLWKAFPEKFLKRVTDLFVLIEADGSWPQEMFKAHVTMIPKDLRTKDPLPSWTCCIGSGPRGMIITWAPAL